MNDKPLFTVSVRDLAEFNLRTGDLSAVFVEPSRALA